MTAIKQGSFVGGELTPSLHSRTDIAKYYAGVKTMRNFFVGRTGSAINRPGTEYIGEVKDSTSAVRLIPFVFNNEQTYVLEFGAGYIRFIKSGAYVMSGPNPYEIGTSYAEDDLMELTFVQNADVMTLAHQNYSPSELKRYADDYWTFTEVSLAPTISAPTNVTNSGAAGTTTVWAVTSVASDTLEESLLSSTTGSSATPSSGAPITVSWTANNDAYEYNIYKKLNGVYGWIGTAIGSSFVDNGITADVSDTPPVNISLVDNLTMNFELLAPDAYPGSDANDVKFSPDGQFMAVACESPGLLKIYQIAGDTFTSIANPAGMPAGAANKIEWSSDSSYLAVAHDTTPFITVYARAGTTFTKLDDPVSLPAGNAHALFWGGSTLIVGTETSPYIDMFSVSGTTITKKAAIPGGGGAGAPTGTITGIALDSIDGIDITSDRYYTATSVAVPYLIRFKYHRGSIGPGTWSFETMIPFALPSNANDVRLDPTSQYLAIAHDSSPYLTWGKTPYSAELGDPADLPDGNATGVAWSSEGQYLAVAHATSQYATIYRRSGDTLTKLSDPVSLPGGNTAACAWEPSNKFLCFAHSSTNKITLYKTLAINPAVVGYYQQRFLLANTINNPEIIYASKTGVFKNFTTHYPTQDSDAVVFQLSGNTVNQIRHLVELQQLIVLTSGGEWVISGDGNGVLSPSSINAKQQSYHGSGIIPPLRIGNKVIFVPKRESMIRDIGFSDTVNGFTGGDLTVFSDHLFKGYSILDWAYQDIPNSIIWVARSDGTLLGLTYMPEQEMLAWHRHDFENGAVENVCVVPEGTEDVLYMVINRTIDGSTVRYVERMASRFVSDVRESIFLDSSLAYDGRNTSVITMTLSGGTNWTYTEDLTLTATDSYFVSGDVGNEIRLTDSDGSVIRCEITAFTSDVIVTVRANRTVPVTLRNTAILEWSKAVDAVTGLDHLEGEDVSVLADGFVVSNPNNPAYTTITVSSGSITLPRPYSIIRVGLPITADIETLDIDVPQGETLADKKKLVTKVGANIEASRGLWAGAEAPSDDDTDALEGLTELKVRDQEGYDDTVDLKTKFVDIQISGSWNSSGKVFLRQIDPLPLTILSIVPVGMVPARG